MGAPAVKSPVIQRPRTNPDVRFSLLMQASSACRVIPNTVHPDTRGPFRKQ